jgi:hypothetical protein
MNLLPVMVLAKSSERPSRGDVVMLPFQVQTVTPVDDVFDCGLVSLDKIPKKYKLVTLPEELQFNAVIKFKE